MDINIKDSEITDFILNYQGWAKCNISYKAENSIFNNINVRKNILNDGYRYFGNTKTFVVNTNNNTFLNNTVLANQVVLDNSNINFDSMM